MAASASIAVDFHGTSLIAFWIDGTPFVAIKPICDALSIDWEAQRVRIHRHPVLNPTAFITKVVAEDGKQRDMLLLPIDKLNGWLFGISAARVRDAATRARLIDYQRECFDVLAAHFGIKSAACARPAWASSYETDSALPVTRVLRNVGVSPFDLGPAAQAAIAQHTWRLSAEAHAAIHDHLSRQVMYHARPRPMRDPAAAEAEVNGVLAAVTLDQALTHRMWAAVRNAQTLISAANAVIGRAHDELARDLETLAHPQAAQRGLAAPPCESP